MAQNSEKKIKKNSNKLFASIEYCKNRTSIVAEKVQSKRHCKKLSTFAFGK